MRIAGSEGWVLYDGDCPFCVRWLHFWEPVLCRRGFGIDKLQASWAAKALGITADEAARDIRLVTQDGRAYSGADVYLQVAKKIWWAWAFGVLFLGRIQMVCCQSAMCLGLLRAKGLMRCQFAQRIVYISLRRTSSSACEVVHSRTRSRAPRKLRSMHSVFCASLTAM